MERTLLVAAHEWRRTLGAGLGGANTSDENVLAATRASTSIERPDPQRTPRTHVWTKPAAAIDLCKPVAPRMRTLFTVFTH